MNFAQKQKDASLDFAYAKQDEAPSVRPRFRTPAPAVQEQAPLQRVETSKSEQEARKSAFSILQSNVVSFEIEKSLDVFGDPQLKKKFTLAQYTSDASTEWANDISRAFEAAKGFPSVQKEIADYLADAFYSDNLFGSDQKRQARDVLDFKLALNSIKTKLTLSEAELKYGVRNEPAKIAIEIHNEPGYKNAPNKTWELAKNGEWAATTKADEIAMVSGELTTPKNSGARQIDLSKEDPHAEPIAVDNIDVAEEIKKEPQAQKSQEPPTEEVQVQTIPYSQIYDGAEKLCAAAAKLSQKDLAFGASIKVLETYFLFDENAQLLGIKPEYAKDEKVGEQCKDILWLAFEATESSPQARTSILQAMRALKEAAFELDARTGEYANYKEISAALQNVAAWGIYKYGKQCATVTYHDFAKKNYEPERQAMFEGLFSGISQTDPTSAQNYLSQANGQMSIYVDLLVNGKGISKVLSTQEAAVNGLSAALWSSNKADGILAAEAMSALEYFQPEMKSAMAKSMLDRAWDERHLQIVRSACIFYLEKGVLGGSFDSKSSKDLKELTMLASSNFDLALSMLIVSSGRSRILFGVDDILTPADTEIFSKYMKSLEQVFSSMGSDEMFAVKKIGKAPMYQKENSKGEMAGASRFGYATHMFNELLQLADPSLEALLRDGYSNIDSIATEKRRSR